MCCVPIASRPCCDTFFKSGRILAVGGWDDKLNQPIASVFTYISDTNMWLELEPMQIARSACFAVTVSDDKLLVVGGNIDERSAHNPHTLSGMHIP